MKDHVDSPEVDVLIEGKRRFDEVIADIPIDQSSRVYMVRVKDGMVDDQGWITVDEARRKNALDRRRYGKTINRYFNNKDFAGAYIDDSTGAGEAMGPEMPGGEMAGPPDVGGTPDLPEDPALAGGPQGGGEAPPPMEPFDPSMPPPPEEAGLPGTDEFPEPMPGGVLDTMGEEPGLGDEFSDDLDDEFSDDLGDEEDLFGAGDELGDIISGEEVEEEEPFELEVPRRIRLVPVKESKESFENLVEDTLLEMSNSTAAETWAQGGRLPPGRLVGDRRRAALAFTDNRAYSYGLPIAQIDRENNVARVHSGTRPSGYRYSMTTTSHIEIVNNALHMAGIETETAEFEHPEGEHFAMPSMSMDIGGLRSYQDVEAPELPVAQRREMPRYRRPRSLQLGLPIGESQKEAFKDAWITTEQMENICSDCAKQMKESKITRVRADVFLLGEKSERDTKASGGDGWPKKVKKGRFTEWCRRNGFEGGASVACAKKAMDSDDASVRGMASFYMNTVKPGGKTASAVGDKEESMQIKDTSEEGVMEALMDGDISAAEAAEMLEKCKVPPQFKSKLDNKAAKVKRAKKNATDKK